MFIWAGALNWRRVGRAEDVPGGFDAAIITDLVDPMASYQAALALLSADRVISPPLLGISVSPSQEAAE
jgi:hypothetical protein